MNKKGVITTVIATLITLTACGGESVDSSNDGKITADEWDASETMLAMNGIEWFTITPEEAEDMSGEFCELAETVDYDLDLFALSLMGTEVPGDEMAQVAIAIMAPACSDALDRLA